ncbi:phage tail protein [Pasteurellaceae bacterium 22721_9_1]
MYFMLGNISFEPANLTDFNETHAAEFAEHQVLKGKPQLQAMGEKLIESHFTLRLHYRLGGVESRYQALLEAQSKQEALALIWGRGKYRGNFVITAISSTTLFTDAEGNVLCREMDISLKEYAGELENNPLGAALNLSSGSLLGSLLPAGITNGLSQVKNAVQKGLEYYNQGKRIVDEVRNTVALVRQFADNPLAAINHLPHALTGLDQALGCFSEVKLLSNIFSEAQKVLPMVAEFGQEVASIYDELNTMRQHFSGANTENAWDDWFTPADTALNNVNNSMDMLAPRVAKMTAWIVLRSDETIEETETDNGTNLS